MRSDRLKSILGKVYGPGTTDQRRKQALEADLLSRYRNLHPKNRRWLMLLNPWNRTVRYIVTSLALVVIVIGACATETTTEVELGKHLQLDLESHSDNESVEGGYEFAVEFISQEGMTREAKKITSVLMTQPGVEDASVSISQQGSGEVTLDILAWGTEFNPDELMTALTESHPFLADASVTINEMTTTIKESYASKIGRSVFNVEVSGTDPEELRRQFLEQLAAQGFEGDAEIDVQTDGDQQTITIELEED